MSHFGICLLGFVVVNKPVIVDCRYVLILLVEVFLGQRFCKWPWENSNTWTWLNLVQYLNLTCIYQLLKENTPTERDLRTVKPKPRKNLRITGPNKICFELKEKQLELCMEVVKCQEDHLDFSKLAETSLQTCHPSPSDKSRKHLQFSAAP